MLDLTILIPTFNNENSLAKLLDSLIWVPNILIVDSFSTDRTLLLARERNIRVVQNHYLNSATQKNWALQFINTEWTLQLDTDEILEDGAKNVISNAILVYGDSIDCFRFPRKNHVLGKWIKYGGIYPDYENRLFKTKKGSWFNREVHSNIRVSGKYMILDTHILHYGMPNITKQLKNIDRYTRYEADELLKKNIKFSYFKWIFFPLFIFLHRYLYLQGFRDGWRGYFLALYASFYYFIYYSKYKELKLLKLHKSP